MNKTLLKIIITIACVIALTVVALGVTFYFLAVYDAPAPDDSAYKTTYAPVPPETNAVVTLEKLQGKVKASLKDYPEFNDSLSESEWENLLSGDLIDFELQVPVVVRNQEALAILSEAMKKPNVQFATFLPGDGTTQNFPARDFLYINKIARMTWQNIRDGKVVFSWDDALANFQFAKKYATAENVTILNFLLALACETGDSDLMIKNIANLEDREVAIKTAFILNGDALQPADLKFWTKGEYSVVEAAVRPMEKIPQEALLQRYVFKPNDTRRRALNVFEKINKAIDDGNLGLDIPPRLNWDTASSVEKTIYMLKPNSSGRALMELSQSNYDALYKNALKNFAPLRVQACAFALRAYWLDHGRLPDSLDELAPEYIKAVPLDIYGGKPVQYDRERGVVYSAGPKLVYGTGEFALNTTPHYAYGDDRYFVLLDWSAQK